jgi:membrane-associated phospholipid phosphatase
MRGRTQIKMTLLMITAYLFADRIVKNLLAMPRPEGACKTSYGFPSSHMVALCVYIFDMMPRSNKSQKFFFLFLIISQAMARIHLKYHTWSQVIGGVIFALAYTYIFNMYINHKIECIPNFKKHNFVKSSINFLK